MDFDQHRWHRVKENYRRWWAGELDRPLLRIAVGGGTPTRPQPRLAKPLAMADFYDLSISPEDLVDRYDYDLSATEYLGDGFPCIWPNLGPGVLATALGAHPEPSRNPDTVWFHSPADRDISDIRFSYDPESTWMKRIKAVCRAAGERWQGLVQVGMTDLGGNLDVLSTFRPAEKLLLDLYDRPEEVKRLTWEEHRAWWAAFDDIDRVMRPLNPGYTAWAPIFSETPTYMLQCDFAYMIGPAMFDEFVAPELAASSKRLANAFYHLDGVGQIPHLDSLLGIRELKGIQWVPGAGQPPEREWPEVYRRIRNAGKLIQMFDWRSFDAVVRALGSGAGIILLAWFRPEERAAAVDLVKRFCPEDGN